MPAKIAVVGSYNGGFTVKTKRLPAMGETILGQRYVEGPGGKGSNQAIAAARLNAEVHFIGCIGQDRNGDAALELWEQEGLQVFVRRDSTNHTGVGLIFLFPDGDNAILVVPGANTSLSPEDVNLMEESIASCQILLLQLEIPVATAIHAAKLAKTHGLKVILNPAPAHQPLPAEAFQFIDVLTPNETEAKLLAGELPNSSISADLVTKKLLDLGTNAIVMTQGKAGATVITASGTETVHAPSVKTVDPTGAGDAFNGALAVALAEGKPLLEAVRWACYAGAHCVTALEVIPGLAQRNQLQAFMQRHEA